MRSVRFQELGRSLRSLAPFVAVMSLVFGFAAGYAAHQDQAYERYELETPFSYVISGLEDAMSPVEAPRVVLTDLSAAAAAEQADPEAKAVSGSAAVLSQHPPGTVAVDVLTDDNPQQIALAYQDEQGRVHTATRVATRAQPWGDWQYDLGVDVGWPGALWGLLVAACGLGLAGLLFLTGFLLSGLGSRATGGDLLDHWRKRVPDTGEFGPREPKEDFAIFAAERATDVDEEAGTVTLRFVVRSYHWSKNKFTPAAKEMLDIRLPYYWSEGSCVKDADLPESIESLPRIWPADTLPPLLSEAWFDFCAAVASWNKERWDEAQDEELAGAERQAEIARQLEALDLLAIPEAHESLLPTGAARASTQ